MQHLSFVFLMTGAPSKPAGPSGGCAWHSQRLAEHGGAASAGCPRDLRLEAQRAPAHLSGCDVLGRSCTERLEAVRAQCGRKTFRLRHDAVLRGEAFTRPLTWPCEDQRSRHHAGVIRVVVQSVLSRRPPHGTHSSGQGPAQWVLSPQHTMTVKGELCGSKRKAGVFLR